MIHHFCKTYKLVSLNRNWETLKKFYRSCKLIIFFHWAQWIYFFYHITSQFRFSEQNKIVYFWYRHNWVVVVHLCVNIFSGFINFSFHLTFMIFTIMINNIGIVCLNVSMDNGDDVYTLGFLEKSMYFAILCFCNYDSEWRMHLDFGV